MSRRIELARGNKQINKIKSPTTMTDFDKKLIAKADAFSRWNYLDICVLIAIADTDEARSRLREIRRDLYDSVQETL